MWAVASWSVRSGSGAARLYLLANLVFVVALFLLSFGSVSFWVLASSYAVAASAAAVAVVIGIRRYQPGVRGGWWWMAAGQSLFAVAETCAGVQEAFGSGYLEPSPADVLYIAAYPPFATGLYRFVRQRTPGLDVASLLDAAIVAVGAGLLGWIYLVEPLADNDALSTAAKVVQGSYPLMDLMLLVLAVRLILGSARRPVALVLVIAATVLLLIGDMAYAVANLLDADTTAEAGSLGWLGCYALLGAAALHPSMTQLDKRCEAAAPDAGIGRLLLLSTAVMTAPVVQIVQLLRGADPHLLLTASGCVVMLGLVMTRMAGVVAAQRVTATTDALTGLKTRRYLEQQLAALIRQALRTNGRAGLLIVDVDHFKTVNDTFGHPGGDQVLVEVARRLTAAMPAGAVVARYGGEEFAVLLPTADLGSAAVAAEAARTVIAATPFEVADVAVTVTASAGGACLSEHICSAEELVLAADRALYAAKNAGRNRSVMHTSLDGEQVPAAAQPPNTDSIHERALTTT